MAASLLQWKSYSRFKAHDMLMLRLIPVVAWIFLGASYVAVLPRNLRLKLLMASHRFRRRPVTERAVHRHFDAIKENALALIPEPSADEVDWA